MVESGENRIAKELDIVKVLPFRRLLSAYMRFTLSKSERTALKNIRKSVVLESSDETSSTDDLTNEWSIKELGKIESAGQKESPLTFKDKLYLSLK